jgi:UDP-N-acetylmuramate dehydrogenase
MGKNVLEGIHAAVRSDELLSGHTTFRIGGPAALFAEPEDLDVLRALVREASGKGIPVRVIGSGSNILVSDRGVQALVVKLSSPFFTKVRFDGDTVHAGAGTLVAQLMRLARERSLGGLEFLAGVPATVGGATVMNAGAWGKQFSDFIEKVHCLDVRGAEVTFSRDSLAFGYRRSGLGKHIVHCVTLRLPAKNPGRIDEEAGAFLRQRCDNQDISCASAGCVFRNPGSASAGRLIESCGLKGTQVGGASVSPKHANFIVNSDHATAADVVKLMNLVRRAVKKMSGITLEKEIKIWK